MNRNIDSNMVDHELPMRRLPFVTFLFFAMAFSVPQGLLSRQPDEKKAKPDLIPLPKKIPAPKDNPISEEKVWLGKLLFFDPRLSGDNKTSCATCHDPKKAWGDGLARARAGKRELARNSQTCLNVAFLPNLFWDGRAKMLEEQALIPIQSAEEMNQRLDELISELKAVPDYRRRFYEVFESKITANGIAKALATFQRTLVTGPSRVDRFLAGDEDALSKSERRGLELFRGGAGCVRCHHGPLLTDGKFHRLGVSFKDKGRGEITGKKEDWYRFRTPSLRNIAETGPYMHNGSLKTLDDVVFFYLRGAPKSGPNGLPIDIEPQSDLSFSASSDLVEFLKALSGPAPKVKLPKLP